MIYRFSHDIVVSVVAPVYNEAAGIADFIKQTVSVLKTIGVNYELLLVNDGSHDDTLRVITREATENNNIRIIDLSRNYGREIAMTAGLDNAIGDYVVLMDSDLQDPPQLIPTMLMHLLDNGIDVVYAARTSRQGESWSKQTASRLFYRIAKRMTGLAIPDDAGDFRIFSRRVVNALNAMKEHNRYLKMLYAYVGFRVGSVPFDRQPRHSGTSSYNWFKLVNAALDAIFAFSVKPLRWMSFVSLATSLVLLTYAATVFIRKLSGADVVEGWASLMLMLTVMFGILFLFLSVISEYIGRILAESKNRPLYYVRTEIGGTSFVIPPLVQSSTSGSSEDDRSA